MTFEIETDLSLKAAAGGWTSKARRQGETVNPADLPQKSRAADDELIFPVISAPRVWPRIFPGL